MADTATYLRNQRVSVYAYPLGGGLSLSSPQRTYTGAFGLALSGPTAVYTILGSADLTAWNQVGMLTNSLGVAVFTDAEATNSSQKFYRAAPR